MKAENVRRTSTKKCSVCLKRKVVGSRAWYKNSTCPACWQKRYKSQFPDKVRNARLKCYYGISLDEFETMLRKQNFKCAICKKLENRTKNGKKHNFVVDHCHKTRAVRGLLCHMCNMRVGVIENWGDKLKKYLRKY